MGVSARKADPRERRNCETAGCSALALMEHLPEASALRALDYLPSLISTITKNFSRSSFEKLLCCDTAHTLFGES